MNETLEHVMNGAAWLDEVRPEWYTMVDTYELCMSVSTECIAGQVFSDAPEETGFDMLYRVHGAKWLKEHAFLFAGRAEWIQQINARLLNESLVAA